MSIIFATFPLSTALEFAVVSAGGCAAIASLVSLSRARYEAAGRPGAT
jgi:DHA2 family multidrug resistance protein-like MFS transporter